MLLLMKNTYSVSIDPFSEGALKFWWQTGFMVSEEGNVCKCTLLAVVNLEVRLILTNDQITWDQQYNKIRDYWIIYSKHFIGKCVYCFIIFAQMFNFRGFFYFFFLRGFVFLSLIYSYNSSDKVALWYISSFLSILCIWVQLYLITKWYNSFNHVPFNVKLLLSLHIQTKIEFQTVME